jgi:hypothetical protein
LTRKSLVMVNDCSVMPQSISWDKGKIQGMPDVPVRRVRATIMACVLEGLQGFP